MLGDRGITYRVNSPFTPWGAINLVGFYLISKERYHVAVLSNPNGRYGLWNLRGIVAYACGGGDAVAVHGRQLYTGPLVQPLGGSDISWIIGLTLSALVYDLMACNSAQSVPDQLFLPVEPASV